MLEKGIQIKCGWCDGYTKAENWEKNTYDQCKSREMRRAYTSIYNKKTFYRKANTFYKCPICDMWSRGCQLKIVGTTDKELLKLGGEPVISEVVDNELNERNGR